MPCTAAVLRLKRGLEMADSGLMHKTLGRCLWALTGALALLCVTAVGVAAVALQGQPLVAQTGEIDPNDISKAVALARTHDPRRTPPGQVTTLQLTDHDMDVLLNHAASRWLGAATRMSMQQNGASLQASLRLARSPIGAWSWLNVQVGLQETASLPWVTSLQVGGLRLPPRVGTWLGRWLIDRAGLLPELNLASDLIKKVDFSPQQLSLSYVLNGDSAQRMVAALLPPGEQDRLRAYSDLLVKLAATQPAFSELSMAQWLGPMFALARERSNSETQAVTENRSAIVALTLYANGRGIDTLLPAARSWPKPTPLRLTLSGRPDFPLHLLISAALAVESTGPLSKAIGVWKELADARGGSGFSFNDIAADRAGTRLGELALTQPLRLQSVLARGVSESDVMPAWADLPEFMPEEEFKRRYGGIGAPRYLAMLAEIDKRVSALPALR
jgi:hypothetical protein